MANWICSCPFSTKGAIRGQPASTGAAASSGSSVSLPCASHVAALSLPADQSRPASSDISTPGPIRAHSSSIIAPVSTSYEPTTVSATSASRRHPLWPGSMTSSIPFNLNDPANSSRPSASRAILARPSHTPPSRLTNIAPASALSILSAAVSAPASASLPSGVPSADPCIRRSIARLIQGSRLSCPRSTWSITNSPASTWRMISA